MADEDPPPGGGATDDAGFLGGFDDTYEIDVITPASEAWGPGMHGGAVPRQTHVPASSVQTTLSELRELGAGGYIGSDQWLPSNEEPKVIAQLQLSLADAGLLDLDDLDHDDLGYYDDATRSAYRDLLTRSNAAGSTWDVTLERLRANPAAQQIKGAKPKELPTVTHPDDLKAIFRAGARRAVGSGKIDDRDLDSMVKVFQDLQANAQSGANAAGGVVTAPPDAEVFADEQAKQRDPVAYDAHKFLDKFSAVSSMLGGG